MDIITEGLGELLIWIVSGIITTITGVIAVIINRKKVRQRMDTMDYSSHREKRKTHYTRNLILDEQIALKIKEDDRIFDDIAFKEWAKETFVEFQKAWSNKNLNSISNRLDKSLCEQYTLLASTNIEEDYKNIIAIETINYVDFSSYSNDNEKEIIEVAINVIMYDYVVNEITKEIISGSDKIKQRTTYKLTFYRRMGTQTNNGSNELICPNCGAKIDIKQNKCAYCNTKILNGIRDWILNNIEKY